MTGMNPLLDFNDLPLFDQVRPEHVAPAIDILLAQSESALQTVTQPEFPARWTEIARVLDTATEKLGRAWGVVSHLNGVADTPELRAKIAEILKIAPDRVSVKATTTEGLGFTGRREGIAAQAIATVKL